MKPLRILIAAAFVLVVAALAGVAQPLQARGQEADGPARSITAAGVGTVTTVPDRAHFSFGVQAQSRTASQAVATSFEAGHSFSTALVMMPSVPSAPMNRCLRS